MLVPIRHGWFVDPFKYSPFPVLFLSKMRFPVPLFLVPSWCPLVMFFFRSPSKYSPARQILLLTLSRIYSPGLFPLFIGFSVVHYQLVVWSPTITTWLFRLSEQDKGTARCVMVLGSHSSVAPRCYHILFGGITIREPSVGPYRLSVVFCDVCFS